MQKRKHCFLCTDKVEITAYVMQCSIYLIFCTLAYVSVGTCTVVVLSECAGFPGVQIGSHINDWNLDAPELLPFFSASVCCSFPFIIYSTFSILFVCTFCLFLTHFMMLMLKCFYACIAICIFFLLWNF